MSNNLLLQTRTPIRLLCLFILLTLGLNSWGQIVDEPCSSSADGWTFTDGGGQPIQQSNYWLLDDVDDEIITKTLNVSEYNNLTLSFQLATYGTGTNHSARVEYSLNDGLAWESIVFNSATPSSSTYISSGTWELGTINCSTFKLKFTSPAGGSKGVRIRNIIFNGVFLDNTPPIWTDSYPQLTNITTSGADVVVNTDEPGAAYYVVVADNDDAPTAAQVIDGHNSTGTAAIAAGNITITAAATIYSATINTLTIGTNYDVYVVAVDDELTPNVQTAPAKIDLTTLATLSNDATLSNLLIDGTTVTGFASNTYSYSVQLPYGTTIVPELTYVVNQPDATAMVTNAAALPGTSTVLVTAQDGTTELTYSVNFTVAEPSSECTVTSAVYTVNNDNETITGVPFGIDLATFKSNITPAEFAAFEVYQADGTTLATDLQEGYLLICTAQNGTTKKTYEIFVLTAQKLLITQYYEGASNDKWIELTNADITDISLGNYYLALWSNVNTGSPVGNAGSYIQLSGTLTPGQSVLYKNSSAANPTYATGTEASSCAFNGNDPVAICFINYSWDNRIDCIYSSGTWGSDKSFVRKPAIKQGSVDQSNFTDGEWIEFSYSDVNNAAEETNERLGYHAFETADVPPAVSSLAPVNNATNVAVNTTLTIAFDEPIAKNTGNITVKLAADNSTFETIDVSSENVTVDGQNAIITLSSNMAYFTNYYVLINEGAFTDLAGNPYAGISANTDWAFKTIVGTPPVLTADNIDNTVDNNIVISFTDNAGWRNAITQVIIDEVVIDPEDYEINGGMLNFLQGTNTQYTTAGTKTVTVKATGYTDAVVEQAFLPGLFNAANSVVSITPVLAPATTSVISLVANDDYNNKIPAYTAKFDITITNYNDATDETYTVDGIEYTASQTNISFATATNVDGQSGISVVMPANIDGNDGIAIQVKNRNGTTALGSSYSYTAPLSPAASISVATALTETNLNGASISLMLQNDFFIDETLDINNFSLNNVPSGVTISSVVYVSSTSATITLAFDGTDFDEEKSISINVDALEVDGAELLISNSLTILAITETAPLVTTNTAITTNGYTTAAWGGNVTADGGDAVTQKGICFATTENPDIESFKTNEGEGIGEITGNMIELTPNTTYYVRAYATNSLGTSYGTQYSFTTLTPFVTIGDLPASGFFASDVVTLTWTYGGIENVKIEIFDGTNWAVLNSSILAENLTADVTIPAAAVPGNDYKFRISSADNELYYSESPVFEIFEPLSNENYIITFEFAFAEAFVDNDNFTVTATAPYGTNVTNVITTFTLSESAIAKIGTTEQVSGVNQNDFTNPVVYTIVAESGLEQEYTVTVTISEPSSECTVTSTVYTVDDAAGTISNVPYGIVLADFKANITPANFATFEVYQADGLTLATAIVNGYKLISTAQNGDTKTYTINVLAEPVAELPITYSGPWQNGLPTGWSQTGLGTDYSGAIAKFDNTGDMLKLHFGQQPDSLYIDLKANVGSGEWSGVFDIFESADGVDYTTVYSFTTDGEIPTGSSAKFGFELLEQSRYIKWVYTTENNGNIGLDNVNVTISTAPSNDATVSSIVYTVDNGAYTITNVPMSATLETFKNNIFAAAGASFEVYQADGTTIATDLQTGYMLICTAQDGTTKLTYTITKNMSLNTETDILTYYIDGKVDTLIDVQAREVIVSMPYGTNVTNLVALFTLSYGATAKVGTTSQVSGETANDFTNPVIYTITAEDGTTTNDWTVTVDVEDPSNDATVASIYYNVNNTAFTITNVPANTSIETFKTNIATASGATFEVYMADSITVATQLVTGCQLIVTAQDGITVNVYEITVSEPATSDLFFSEYIEGSSSNKAIEIYNPTGNSISLSGYQIKLATNGGSWQSTPLMLTGTLDANQVYVIYNSSAAAGISTVGDTASTVTNFNGDDAVGLFKADELIDIIGVQGIDPGVGWNVAGIENATLDHTLVRKPHITVGNTNWELSAGTNTENSEWVVYDKDIFEFLGSHSTEVPVDTVSPYVTFNPENNANNVNVTINPTLTFNENVLSADSVAFANGAGFTQHIQMFETLTPENAVSFEATITGKVVTVVPAASLKYETMYSVILTDSVVRDATGNFNLADTLMFTTLSETLPIISDVTVYGSQPLYAGDTIAVEFTSANVENIKVELYVPQITGYITLAEYAPAASGQVNVRLPDTLLYNSGYSVKVTDSLNTSIFAETEAFEIRMVATNLSQLLSLPANDIVKYTGEATITYMRQARNQKYIQDTTAAVLIDDNTTAPGFITDTTFVVGDGITNIVGKITVYNGLVEFVPTEVTGQKTQGPAILPETRTVESITNADQCKLVKIENFKFADVNQHSTEGLFVTGKNYTVDGVESTAFAFRTAFAETDYINTAVPENAITLVGLVGRYNDQMQITARNLADFNPGLSDDATLANIYIGESPVENFNADVLEYSIVVPYGTTNIPVVTALANNANAEIEIDQAETLPGTAIITVFAENGVNRLVYNVNFTVAPNTDAKLAAILVNGTNIDNFVADSLVYNYGLPFGTIDLPVVTAVAADTNATVEIVQTAQLTGFATITVTAADNQTSLTYKVNFTVLPNTDATLSAIMVDSVMVEGFDPQTTAYVYKHADSLTVVPTVTATTTDSNAIVLITPATGLPGTTLIKVTAADTTITKTYEVHFVSDSISSDATLVALTVDDEPIQGFKPDSLDYSIVLPYGTTFIPQVKATANNNRAKVTIYQATELPGVATVQVVADDNVTELFYTVTMLVAKNTDATLAVITVNNDTISGFNPSVFEYVIGVDINSALPVVNAIASSNQATVTVEQAVELPGKATINVAAADTAYKNVYVVHFVDSTLSNNSLLSKLFTDSVEIEGFTDTVFEYTITLPFATTKIPVVTVEVQDTNSTVEITQAGQLPGVAKVKVIAPDGATYSVYTVNFNIEPASTNALLASLMVDNSLVQGFNDTIFEYNVELPVGTTKIPVVSATAKHTGALVIVTQASELPGEAYVNVKAQDGFTVLTYTVNFTVKVKTITFNVTDSEPITGAEIEFNSQTKATDSNGKAEFVLNVETGEFAYTVTKQGYIVVTGTVDIATTSVVNVTLNKVGIYETGAQLLSVYPNPTQGVITVKLPSGITNADIAIINISGKLQNVVNINNNDKIDLSKLPQGIYVLKVVNSNVWQKIIIE